MIVCCEKSGSGHRVFQMESKMDDGWNIGMPVLLDCLRKDIYLIAIKRRFTVAGEHPLDFESHSRKPVIFE